MARFEGPLGMLPATDDEHVMKYGLTIDRMPDDATSGVFGINWYASFDSPELVVVGQEKGLKRAVSRYYIGRGTRWGSVRGGHAICARSPHHKDHAGWWSFYDQGQEGACVGFAISRQQTLHNRQKYDAVGIYEAAKKIDEWPGEDYDGTSVRAGYDVARDQGLCVVRMQGGRQVIDLPRADCGIERNFWATSVEQIAQCLSPYDNGDQILNKAQAVPLLNSWGKRYPHEVWLPLEAVQRLMDEGGEFGISIDRV